MRIISFEELKNIVKSGDVVAVSAILVANLPAEIFKHLTEQHDKTGKPDQLTFMMANDISDYHGGYDLDSFVNRGMVKRLITSLITASPGTIQSINNNEIEAYFFPQGILATQYRTQAFSSPGMISKIGLNTVIDPRNTGGQANQVTDEDLVSLLTIKGEEYLHYELPDINVALLRGTYADDKGNIFMTHEAHHGEGFSVAAATHKNGGKVIVQVKQIIQSGTFHPNDVFIPGELIDYVVVNEDPKYHMQAIQRYYDPALSGHYRILKTEEPFIELSRRKVILRRSAQFLLEGDTVSIGFGINNELSNVLIEEGVNDLVQLNVDTGIFGGMIGSRDYFGMNYNMDARVPQDMSWEFIYNGGLDIAYLSFAEIDRFGNVNVSRFGDKISGSGGFIDISQTVKTIIFSGTMVVGGQTTCKDKKLVIEEEGLTRKFVDDVQSIDFNAEYAKTLKQDVYYVTERAVFQLTAEGLELIEIAPGIDLQRDILPNMAFVPIISNHLKMMDEDIYQKDWGRLYEAMQNKTRIKKGEDKYEL